MDMMNPYDLLESVLVTIENGLKEGITVDSAADEFKLSTRHLQRLFKLAFNQSMGSYIRSRKLAASIDDLLNTDLNVLDIALDYDFEYEQSYIRSFRREYGITPGDLRKTGKILKITPPLQLFNSQKYPNGIMFGPEIVVVPQFRVVGKKHKLAFRDGITLPQFFAKQFFDRERNNIPNAINQNTLICVTSEAEDDADYNYSMPAVQVKTLNAIPEGFEGFTFPTSLCAKFHFICNAEDEFNLHVGDEMFKAINNFMDSEDQKYFLERKKIDIVISDLSDRYENYPQNEAWRLTKIEWLSPVIKKTLLKIPPLSPSGIKNVCKQELPALRFIGKKCVETSDPPNVLKLLDNWQLNGWFDAIEKQSDIGYKTFSEDGGAFKKDDAYINLARKKGDSFQESDLFEYWMGMFMPEGTEIPHGYEAIDFPRMTIGVCSVYGKRNEIVNYETACRNKLTEEGLAPEKALWHFRRFNWREFYKEDIYGKRLLDYCYPVS